MVRLIALGITPGAKAEMDDPAEDAALMARIGAKASCIFLDIPPDAKGEVNDPVKHAALMAWIGAMLEKDNRNGLGVEYRLENETTGMQFTFGWIQRSDPRHSYWQLRRLE